MNFVLLWERQEFFKKFPEWDPYGNKRFRSTTRTLVLLDPLERYGL